MRRRVNKIIIQMILMVLQKNWAMNKNEEDVEYIEIQHEYNDSIKSKISEGITEEDVIFTILSKNNRAK